MFSLNDVGFLGSLNQTPTDPDFANVSLLLHGDGTNGSTTIVDSSPSPKTVTVNGNAQISTSVADPFGGSRGSILFDGNGDWLQVANTAAFQFGTGAFTIEMFIRATGGFATGLIEQRTGPTGIPWLYYVQTNNTTRFFNGTDYASSASYTPNSWQYLALLRKPDNTLEMWIHGARVFQQTITTNLTTAATNMLIMRSADNAVFNGRLAELRITKSIARDVSQIPTAPFPDA
jgi:hypothetical protein